MHNSSACVENEFYVQQSSNYSIKMMSMAYDRREDHLKVVARVSDASERIYFQLSNSGIIKTLIEARLTFLFQNFFSLLFFSTNSRSSFKLIKLQQSEIKDKNARSFPFPRVY